MRRALALLAGLLLATQLASQPAAAMEPQSSTSLSIQQRGRSPSPAPQPGTLPGSGTFTSIAPDLHVEIGKAWWDDNVRHTIFVVSNDGSATASEVFFVSTVTVNDNQKIVAGHAVGDMVPGQQEKFEVTCANQPNIKCASIKLAATSQSPDENKANNAATDER